jgi:hypothetical protein
MNILWVLPSIFVFLSASLIWFLIGSRGVWWLKLAMVIITPLLALWAWVSIDDVFGYPKETTGDQLKGKTATLFFQVVDEPKSIFLWVKMDGDNKMRLYQIPYTKSLHKTVDESGAGDKGPEHVKFEGSLVSKSGGEGGSTQGDLEFYVLPPALSPSK